MTLEYGTDVLSRNVGKYQSTLHDISEERRSYLSITLLSLFPSTLNLLPACIPKKEYWALHGKFQSCHFSATSPIINVISRTLYSLLLLILLLVLGI